MLYLDYAKQMNNGYILNFFADNEDDILEVADGKEFITKNGTNYGVPLASSTVVITMPDKSEKTYVFNDEGVWEIGGEKSGTEVEVNVETTDQDEDLKSLKVGGVTYNNIKMTPAFGTVLPSNEALKGVEYNEKIYRIPVGMIPSRSTAPVTGDNITKMEYDGKIYSTGVSINSDSYDYMKKDVLNYIVNNDTVYSLPEYKGLVLYSGAENPTEELGAVQDSSTGTVYSVGGGLTPYTGTAAATKDLDKVEYKGTVYSVGIPTLVMQVKKSDDGSSFVTVDTMEYNDFEAFVKKYMAGEINIRFKLLAESSGFFDNDWYFDAICMHNNRGCSSYVGRSFPFYCLAKLNDADETPSICKVIVQSK